jgi:hypothetical protein
LIIISVRELFKGILFFCYLPLIRFSPRPLFGVLDCAKSIVVVERMSDGMLVIKKKEVRKMTYLARDPSGSLLSCCWKAYLIVSSYRRGRESLVSLMAS